MTFGSLAVALFGVGGALVSEESICLMDHFFFFRFVREWRCGLWSVGVIGMWMIFERAGSGVCSVLVCTRMNMKFSAAFSISV